MGNILQKPFRLSAKVLIHDASDHCLLLKRSLKSQGNPGKWDLPGGKVEGAETFEHALFREVAEETGLAISLERVLGASESESPVARVAYLILEGRLESGELRLSDEHDGYIWIHRQELAGIEIADQFKPFLIAYSQTDIRPR